SIVEPPHPQQTSYGVSDERIRGLGFQPKGSLEKGVREVVERFKAFLPCVRKRCRAALRWMLKLVILNARNSVSRILNAVIFNSVCRLAV
ncbi:MAG: hypothetical protein QXO64_04055, partial [Thermofilaceae archaeon]